VGNVGNISKTENAQKFWSVKLMGGNERDSEKRRKYQNVQRRDFEHGYERYGSM